MPLHQHTAPGGARTTAMSAEAVPLDSLQNISTEVAGTDPQGLPWGGFKKGHYRRQFAEAAGRNGWGQEGTKCASRTLTRYNPADGTLTIIPALCGCFGCELCGVRRASWLKTELAAAIARPKLGLVQFLTLTLRVNALGRSPRQSWDDGATYWNRMRLRASRRFGAFSYVWVVEPTKQGTWHLHLSTSLQAAPSEIAEEWLASTGDSYIVDSEPAGSERVINYLAKYSTKMAGLRGTPEWEFLKGRRIFSKSQDVQFAPFKQPAEEPGRWQVWARPYWEAAELLASSAPIVAARSRGVPRLTVASAGEPVYGVPLEVRNRSG